MTLTYTCYRFDALPPTVLYRLLALRIDVFGIAAGLLYQDLDGLDETAWHVVAQTPEGEVVGCLRVLLTDPKTIGRVVTHPDWRHQGVATRLMEVAIDEIERVYPGAVMMLNARTFAKGLYAKLGFKEVGDEFIEVGVPHIRMERHP